MNLDKKSLSIINTDQYKNYLNLKFSKNELKPFFCLNMYTILTSYKSFIDKNENNKCWDYTKKISNNYELINQNGSLSITGINPLSRSYYKFREMVLDFNLDFRVRTCRTAPPYIMDDRRIRTAAPGCHVKQDTSTRRARRPEIISMSLHLTECENLYFEYI